MRLTIFNQKVSKAEDVSEKVKPRKDNSRISLDSSYLPRVDLKGPKFELFVKMNGGERFEAFMKNDN